MLRLKKQSTSLVTAQDCGQNLEATAQHLRWDSIKKSNIN